VYVELELPADLLSASLMTSVAARPCVAMFETEMMMCRTCDSHGVPAGTKRVIIPVVCGRIINDT
jgi:hypothetical protein